MNQAALNRLLHIGLKFNKDPITNLKLTFLPVFIFLVLHALLGTLEILLNHLLHGRTFVQPLL